jgi:hypothetical protein
MSRTRVEHQRLVIENGPNALRRFMDAYMSNSNTACQVYSPFTSSAANIKAAGGALASDAAEHLLNVGRGTACSRLGAANVYGA